MNRVSRFRSTSFGIAGLIVVSFASANTVIVNSNNGGFGDLVSGVGDASVALSDGWSYSNLRGDAAGAQIGINTTFARSGSGSAYMETSSGIGKADIQLTSVTPLGTLGSLSHFSYEWYKSSASTAAQHPALRLLWANVNEQGGVTAWGQLIFERAYNGGNIATDSWQFDDAFSGNLWMFQSGVGVQEVYNRKLSNWIAGETNAGFAALSANTIIWGVNAGVGSGWSGSFVGAVDNITLGFDGVATTYNFEPIPEPATMIALSLGGALMALRRRRSKK